jgi:WD40 repeat protein
VLIDRPTSWGSARLLGGILAAVVMFAGCTMSRMPIDSGPVFLRVAGVRRVSDRIAVSPPAWAPRGRRLAFSTDEAVWMLSLDQHDEQRLASLPHVTEVGWAPTGRRLAALSAGRLCVLSLDGAPPRPVAAPPDVRLFAWARSGTHLAYVAARGGRDTLWVTDDEDADREPKTSRAYLAIPEPLEARMVAWLPGGQEMIVAAGPRNLDVTDRFFIVTGSGIGTRPLRLRDAARYPEVAPTGRFLAFLEGTAGDVLSGRGEVTIIREDGTGRRVLEPPGVYGGLAWSPSGSTLALGRADQGHIAVEIVDAVTGSRLLVDDYRPEIPSSGSAFSIAWSPDGRALAFGTNTGATVGPLWVATLTR